MIDQKLIHLLPISEIQVLDRARTEFGNIDELAESIERFTQALPNTRGLIHPILVKHDNGQFRLVAGGRRLLAHERLSRDSIAALITDELPEHVLLDLELEENYQRKQMLWQEECIRIYQIHQQKQAEAAVDRSTWGTRQTGKLIGFSCAHISNCQMVARALLQGDEELAKQPNMTAALNTLLLRREDESLKRLVQDSGAKVIAPVKPKPAPVSSPIVFEEEEPMTEDATIASVEYNLSSTIHHIDCLEFLATLAESSVDHIITDPPYGISMENLTPDVSRVEATHQVEDNLKLLEAFLPLAHKVLKPNGFLLFWYDLDHHEKLAAWARKAKFRVQRWPMIWCKTSQCSNSAAQFNLTKSTEYCYFMRKSPEATLALRNQDNYFFHSGAKEALSQPFTHPFAKPFGVWKKLVEIVSVPGDLILDPFAGELSLPCALVNLGRKFLACEYEEHHYNAGLEFIKAEIQELTNNQAKFV